MARILAIDYGKKRCGIAVTDPMQIIAQGLTTVNTPELLNFLKDYCLTEEVECFVVGLPLNLQAEATDATAAADQFVSRLQEQFPDKAIERIDERFTSVLAQRAIIASGVKKKKRRNKALLDEVSATIILQSYMDRKR